jgi:tRNA(Ile)-lysidine synthase
MSEIAIAVGDFLQETSTDSKIVVAYSGGVDSTVLLHALAQHKNDHAISALHINHDLYPEADVWQGIAEQNCRELGIALQTVKLHAKKQAGESIEAWAREQRLKVFAEKLPASAYLLTAQHADDQTETILLQLFRGSGAKGLMGMPKEKPLGQGFLARPLLAVEKQDILDYAVQHKLNWAEDHSNQNTRFDRNFLRQEIMPKLKQRWPALNKTCARTASHLAELDGMRAAYNAAPTLNIQELQHATTPQQKQIIRSWLEQNGFSMPPTTKLEEILNSVIPAREDANPEVTWNNTHIRRYQSELYVLKPEELISLEGMEFEWDGTPLELPHGAGLVVLSGTRVACNATPTVGAAFYAARSCVARHMYHIELTNFPAKICFRTTGAKVKIAGRPSKTLKSFFQEMKVPPWQRGRIPFLAQNDHLLPLEMILVNYKRN